MDRSRRHQLLLGVLALVLAGVVVRNWPRTAGTPQSATHAAGRRSIATTSEAKGESVHLEALRPADDSEAEVARNLFRFKSAVAPVARSAGAPLPPPGPIVPPAPVGPPPIAMKFIGLVEALVPAQRIAVLSDPRGVYEGREGDVIEGRYRIVRIGAESVEMAHLDGRGRQTIRLSGS